jgi:hypothetical protein
LKSSLKKSDTALRTQRFVTERNFLISDKKIQPEDKKSESADKPEVEKKKDEAGQLPDEALDKVTGGAGVSSPLRRGGVWP